MRALVQKEILPAGEEVIHYGVPAIQINGKSIAGYASAKKYCSYFPHSGALLEPLADSLTKYDYSKGTLHFQVDKCLPITLIRKLVKARLMQLGMTASGELTQSTTTQYPANKLHRKNAKQHH